MNPLRPLAAIADLLWHAWRGIRCTCGQRVRVQAWDFHQRFDHGGEQP